MDKESSMSTTCVQDLIIKVERFLAKGMLEDTKTEDEIKSMREQECIEVTVHGKKTEKVSLHELENKFLKQEQKNARISIPNRDFLSWKANFPLNETSDDLLKKMTHEYTEMCKLGEKNNQGKELDIDEQLKKMHEGQTAVETSLNVTDLFDPPNAKVRKKMEREIREALKEDDIGGQKKGIMNVARSILHEGIDIGIRMQNKSKWGAVNNRRGQIAENRTMEAINEALEEFLGISVMGMKTHTYLYKFLGSLNLKLTYENILNPDTGKVMKNNEVEHDLITTWMEQDTLVVNMVQSKIKEVKPWLQTADQESIANAAIKHAKDALIQLHKDFSTFKEIFPDIPKTLMKKIRFQFFVSLSDVSCKDWPGDRSKDHILFKEDIENIACLQSKLKIPDAPPDPSSISADVRKLQNTISARYVGGASLISIKTPEEGFAKHEALMKKVRTGYEGQIEKVFMLGREQQAVFQAGLFNYSNFGGHGSGKTVLLQASIIRDAQNIVVDKDSLIHHLQIICIWHKGADALIKQYHQLASTLPKGDNLEVMVVTKEELMKRFKANEETVETTYQINTICDNISLLVKNKRVHLYIDECWITVPKKFSAHLTPGNPNDVVGHIPFIRKGVLYSWSKLDPGQVELSVAVMPDCQHLLEKDLITDPPPKQGPVLTVFAPRSFRTTMRIHRFIQHIQERVEMDLRVWRYLLPPRDELDGHEIMGSLPVWQPIEQTDHFICQKDGCEGCYLRNILKPLETHYSDAINIHGAKPDDVVFILNQDIQGIYPDAIQAESFLNEKFPGVEIKFGDDFEGMEKQVVFNLTNGNIGSLPSIIPLSLTRANNHLVMFIKDFRNILKDATVKSLVKKMKCDLTSVDTSNEQNELATGLKEASNLLASLARNIPLASIKILAQEWGVQVLCDELILEEKTRFQMIDLMSKRHFEENPTISMTQFMESLKSVNMATDVSTKISNNLKTKIEEIRDMVAAKNLTDNEQIELAHSLGQRGLFISLTQPTDTSIAAVSDQEALQICLTTWNSQATERTTTEELMNCLLMAGLSRIVVEVQERSTENWEIASFENMSVKEKIGVTVWDVFFPILTTTITIALMAVLFSEQKYSLLWILILLHWIPSAFFSTIHIYFNHNVLGSTLNIPKKVWPLLIIVQPVSNTVLYAMYLLKRARYTGQAVERYKMQKMLEIAEASKMMNNFTSLLVLIFTIHLANTRVITGNEPALLSLSIITGLLHLAKLLISTVMNHTNFSSKFCLQIYLLALSAVSSLILKIVSIVVLLSAETDFGVLCGTISFVVGLVANMWLEIKLMAVDAESEENNIWLRVVHSMIYPLAPKLKNRKQLLVACLQLSVGNIVASTLGFSIAFALGVTENLFITTNMIKALSLATVFLGLYSAVIHCGISIQQTLFVSPESDGDLEEISEEISESTPLIRSNGRDTGRGNTLSNVAWATVPLTVLALILMSPYHLMLFQFNTCNALPSDSQTHVVCDQAPLTVGTICTISCPSLYWSTSFIHSSCTWRGVWNVTDSTCKPQAAVLIGQGWNETSRKWESITHMYPQTDSKHLLPGLSKSGGLSAYIDGSLIYCGGYKTTDSRTAVGSCHSLKHPVPKWVKTFPLLQATRLASTAVIEKGQALWILGGENASQDPQIITQIVRSGMPTERGPDMTEIAVGHCSVTLEDGSVIVTGGLRRSNVDGSSKTEIYSFKTKKWSKKRDMKQRRLWHSCTQVLLRPDEPNSHILSPIVTNTSIISIVVAGGFYYNGKVVHYTNSVELYLPWNDTWIDFPPLPNFTNDKGAVLKMSSPLLMFLPLAGHNYRLNLLGGASYDQDNLETMTDLVWHLKFHRGNHTFFWSQELDPLNMIMDYMNTAVVGVPYNFISFFDFESSLGRGLFG